MMLRLWGDRAGTHKGQAGVMKIERALPLVLPLSHDGIKNSIARGHDSTVETRERVLVSSLVPVAITQLTADVV